MDIGLDASKERRPEILAAQSDPGGNEPGRARKTARLVRPQAWSEGMRASLAAPAVVPLLHGASGPWDDLAVFASIVLILGVMIVLSWRAGRDKRKQKRAARKARRRR